LFLGGLDYNDRIDGASTPGGRPAVTSPADDDMRYMWTDDALPVTPAFLKNQLKYDKPRAQVCMKQPLFMYVHKGPVHCPIVTVLLEPYGWLKHVNIIIIMVAVFTDSKLVSN